MDNKKELGSDGRNYGQFAYFASRAKNCVLVYKPRVETILANGEVVVGKDDAGNLMKGERIEFYNGNKIYEKTEENKERIEFLQEKILHELALPNNKKTFIELTKPIKQIPEDEVAKLLAEKDEEIARLKGESTEAPVTPEVTAPETGAEPAQAEKPVETTPTTPAPADKTENPEVKKANVPF